MRIASLALGLVIVAGGSARAQTLTAEDYAEIRNLGQYYNLGYDSSARADAGALVARYFTPDMSFTRDGGPNWYSAKEMADYAAKATTGTHHWDSNFVIQPDTQGAKMFRYTLVYRVGEKGTPVSISSAGPIYEQLVKTPDGWFIKNRYNFTVGGAKAVEFPRFDGKPVAPAAQQSAARAAKGAKTSPLTPLDYIEIEMLYGWNNIALDSVAEKGEMFARTFTPDGSIQADGVTITGRAKLAEFAARSEPAIRRWLSNLYVEPSPEGAIGWAYILTVDGLGVHSRPAKPPTPSIDTGVLYRDVLVKTPEGWRFKSRASTPGNGVPASLPLPKAR